MSDKSKLTEICYDEGANRPEGNPLVIIMVVVFCVGLILTFATGFVEGAVPLDASKQNPQVSIPKWIPPVAQKVELPSVVDEKTANELAERWGIELLSLRLTAGGYMIDFRFRVLDVEKSKSFFDHRVKPLLVVERSNAKLPIPMAAKVGAFRATNRGKNIKPDKTYYMVFGNPDAHVKSGEKVTMVIGEFKAEHLIVH
ncbi:MAG: hypothetical protein ABW092_02470 [Candidatus Thiodiazotropha sp.]